MEANLNGEMNLKIETDLVSVTTHFKDLGNPPWGRCIPFTCVVCIKAHRSKTFLKNLMLAMATNKFQSRLFWPSSGDDGSQGRSQSRDPEVMAHTRVDIRKLQQFLMGQQVNPSKAMCSESTLIDFLLILTILTNQLL